MPLYAFTTATFTPGGATGQNGPSLAQALTGLTGPETAVWKSNTSYFNTSSGMQLWTVPTNGTYRIVVSGAQGGNPTGMIGGRGARMQGDFVLTQGEVIRILVGQQGQVGGHSQNTGQSVTAGGGGSFVVRTPYNTNASILAIAGGGGGGANNTWTIADGRPAVITTNGNSGQQGGTTYGINGGGATGATEGGPGAGFLGDGATPSGTPALDTAKSFLNGGAGGRNARSWAGPEIYGGFGGGGGGGGLSAGGGGGYSGGAAGSWSSQQAGGGGGSYNSADDQVNAGDVITGSGVVTVTYLGNPPDGLIASPRSAAFSETFTVTLNLGIAGASDGTLVPYTLSGVTSADINGASLTGNFTIASSTASLTVVTVASLPLLNKTFSITASGYTRTVSLTYLLSGTLPSSGGVTALTSVITDSPKMQSTTANSLSQNGVFEYSNVRSVISSVVTSTPVVASTLASSLTTDGILVYAATRAVLTGFSSTVLGQFGSGPVISPASRQILIR